MMTNIQAQAYAVLALKALGIDGETIHAVEGKMYRLFDELSEEEAAEKAFGIKSSPKRACECCGSTNDVADLSIADIVIDMCQVCRTTWWSKSKQASKAAKLDKQAVIQLVNETA